VCLKVLLPLSVSGEAAFKVFLWLKKRKKMRERDFEKITT
jgi:hypothetical protein